MRIGLGTTLVLWLALAGLARAQAPAGPAPLAVPAPSPTSAYGGAASAVPNAAVWSPSPQTVLDPNTGPYPAAGFDPEAVVDNSGDFDAPADRGNTTLGGVAYGSIEYLLWYPRRADLPQVVVTYPVTAVSAEGAVDPQFVGPILGGTRDGTPAGALNGVRVTAGAWLDNAQEYALEASYFGLPEISQSVSGSSTANGFPLLSRSFQDLTADNTFLYYRIATPNDLSGGFRYSTDIAMQGLEGLFRWRGPQIFSDRFDFLVGVRYLDIREGLDISDRSTALSDNGAAALAPALAASGLVGVGSTLSTYDSFKTRNQFYGAQFGGHSRFSTFGGRLTLDVIGKFALGGLNQTVKIEGGSTLTNPNGQVFSVGGGTLTGRNNIGRYTDTKFIVVPELTVNGGYKITQNILGFIGYNAIYLQQTQRPGNSIDPGVNVSNLPFRGANFPTSGVARPGFTFSQTEAFWIQGLNVGLQFTY